MKIIGLIGGMSWESSIEYYRIINETAKEKLGDLHSAKSVMVTVDFGAIEPLMRQGRWGEITQQLICAARAVENGGADFLLMCTNTMHKMIDEIQSSIRIPILHIADATAQQVIADGLKKVGLLGTRVTMEEDFYSGRLRQQFGLEVLIPTAQEREIVDSVIFDELCLGIVNPASKTQYQRIIENLVAAGAQGIILGCTEIGLLIHVEDSPAPLYDTARIHAVRAVEYALEK